MFFNDKKIRYKISQTIKNRNLSKGVLVKRTKQERKITKNVEQKLVNVKTQNFEKSIKQYVQWIADTNLSARLSGVDFAAKV